MKNMSDTIDSLIDEVQEAIEDEFFGIADSRYPDDMLSEIAGNSIPDYYSDLASCLLSDTNLAYCDSVDSSAGVWEIIRGAIYERLSIEANRIYEELCDEHRCADCGDVITSKLDYDASLEAFGEPLCSYCLETRKEEGDEGDEDNSD